MRRGRGARITLLIIDGWGGVLMEGMWGCVLVNKVCQYGVIG